MKPPSEEVLRDDYARTLDVYKALVDVRFRLLVLVPAAAAVTTGLLAKHDVAEAPAARGPLALLGLVVTAGLIVYEIRNSQLHDAVVHRLKFLEVLLGIPPSTNRDVGGVMNERPPRPQFLGFLEVQHDLALSIVYGTSIGAWTWLLLTSPWPLPDLLKTQCIKQTPDPSWWWPACWSYGPLLFAIVAGLLAARVVIAMSRVGRPPPGYTAVILDPDATRELNQPLPVDTVQVVKDVLNQIVDGSRKHEELPLDKANLVCSFGFAEQRDIRGIVPPWNCRYICRREGCKLSPKDGERRSRTWVKATERGKAHRENADEAKRKNELAAILTKKVYFYQEVRDSKETSAAKLRAELLRAGVFGQKTIPAPWLDTDQVKYRIGWRDRL